MNDRVKLVAYWFLDRRKTPLQRKSNVVPTAPGTPPAKPGEQPPVQPKALAEPKPEAADQSGPKAVPAAA